MKEKKLTAARVILTLLTVAAIAAIFYNSSQDAVESTERSSPLTDWINGILAGFPIPFSVTENFIRKLAHFAEYSFLGALLSVTYYVHLRKIKTALIATLITGAVVATIDEIIQLFPAGRSCQVSDILLDCCGVAFAAAIVMLIIRAIKNKRRKKLSKES
ncbi:VanZ family protein [Ruminococcus difficilis]|uniref:VanZ family protein n=1 Tax=Ruminococcus difficilis TaxID=2763069 RepID=A0A934TYH1_9FIRM|nr:VanZ family protein [Ruminococcus difficilis]MBK6088051.1 VanZ family protein [Ruminococcus difficilis]